MEQNQDLQQIGMKSSFLGIELFLPWKLTARYMFLLLQLLSEYIRSPVFILVHSLLFLCSFFSLRKRHLFLAAGLTSNDSCLSLWGASFWGCDKCFHEELLLYQTLAVCQEGRADCQERITSTADGHYPEFRPSIWVHLIFWLKRQRACGASCNLSAWKKPRKVWFTGRGNAFICKEPSVLIVGAYQ